MSVSEDACRKVFTRLTNIKKLASQSAAKSKGKAAKNISNDVVAHLGLNTDGSDVLDGLVQTPFSE